MILEVQRLSREEKLSNTEIKNLLGISYRRIRRYLQGDADTICIDGRHEHVVPSALDPYLSVISSGIENGKDYKTIFAELKESGFTGGYSTLAKFCEKNFGRKKGNGSVHPSRQTEHYVSRKTVLEHIWSGKPMDTYDKQYIFTLHPELLILKEIIYEFRKAMDNRDLVNLNGWIEKITDSSFSPIASLCRGIMLDIEPVRNSVRYNASNAFLEGNVNRLKEIKRSMYGRASYGLLRAKVLRGVVCL